jgi:uncharacterized protein
MGFHGDSAITDNSNINSQNFSDFGTYLIKDKFTISVPNTKIHFQRLSDDKYQYIRQGTSKTESLISIRTDNLEVEFVPSFPIFVPAYRTDYVYLNFKKPIFVSRESSTEIFVPVPIENALYFTGPEINEYIDVFSCKPETARFGLYGPPEEGKLCKFANISVEYEDRDFEPFLYAKMRVKIDNELENGIKLGKLIFPITNHELYYNEKTAVLDDLRLVIKDRLGVVYGDVECEDTHMGGWSKAPRSMERTEHKFVMGMGF